MHKKLNQELNTLSSKRWREERFGVEMVTIYFTLVVRNVKKQFLSKGILITLHGVTLILTKIQKWNQEKSVNKCQKQILLIQEVELRKPNSFYLRSLENINLSSSNVSTKNINIWSYKDICEYQN